MKIEEKCYLVFAAYVLYHLIDGFDLWEIFEVGFMEVAVGVKAEDSCSGVAEEDSIWIDHRDNEEDEVV